MQLRSLSHWPLLTALVVVFVMLLPKVAQANSEQEDTWYQIEVIIATRADNAPNLESFPLQPAPVTWRQGRSLIPFDLATSDPNLLENVEFINLPTDQRMLNSEARTLANNASYQLLVHQSWRQILKGNKAITWIDIKAGNDWADRQLKGSLGFSKGRYLHVFSQLHLDQFQRISKPNSLAASQSLMRAVETRYSLIQRRKMRSEELHYLDHPKLVLLVKVIPFTPAEPISEAAAADALPLIDLTVPNTAD